MNYISGQARRFARLGNLLVAQLLIVCVLAACAPGSGTIIRALQAYRSVQSGIDTAQHKERWPISPGIYDKQLILSRGVYTAYEDVKEVAQSYALTEASLPVDILRFAVIGDYGRNTIGEQRVATLVDSWNPDFIVTTGDNNYPFGSALSIDVNIGQYYSKFIGNYKGVYGPGSERNRFWPTLGNHDWHAMRCIAQECSGAYLDYFTLPGNERYYDVSQGLVHLFVTDSDSQEPAGNDLDSDQARWLQNALAASTSCFKVVIVHRPPYSSGDHGSAISMRWPFQEWGADVVMSGNDHSYERIDANGFPYFVNGAGGAGLRGFPNTGLLPEGIVSVVRYNEDHGAMLVTATDAGILYQFFNTDGVMIDQLSIDKDCVVAPAVDFGNYLPLISFDTDQIQLISNMPGIY